MVRLRNPRFHFLRNRTFPAYKPSVWRKMGHGAVVSNSGGTKGGQLTGNNIEGRAPGLSGLSSEICRGGGWGEGVVSGVSVRSELG